MNSEQKRIIFFCKSFLPEYTPESIRTASFLKYLLRDNWDLSLFTWSEGEITDDKYNYLKSVHIQRIKKVFKLNIIFVTYVVNYLLMAIKTIYEINRLSKQQNIKYLFVSIPQLQPLLIGSFVKIFNRKLILTEEIRDLYSIAHWYRKNPIKQKLLFIVERLLMKRVDKFIFVTRIIKKDYIDNFKNIKNLKNGKVILNAFDPEDYPKTKKENDSSNNMVFTYTGRIYGRRNIDNFICAIGEIIESGSIFKGGVEINIVGDIDKKNLINIKSLVNKFKLESIVKIVGVLSHSECIKCQSNSSFNIIIAHDIGSEYAIPSKLFEYIAAKKPIVAVSEDPLVIEIMEKYKLGLHCRNNSEDIKNVLLQIMRNEFEYNETTIPEEFKRDSQIRKITEFITS